MLTSNTPTSLHFAFKGGTVALTKAGEELLSKVSTKDIETAWERYWTLFPDRAPRKIELSVSSSMKSRWHNKFRKGIDLYGDGVLGLVPVVFKRGNRGKRPDAITVATVEIRKNYGTNCEIKHLASGTVVRKGNITTHHMFT